MEAATDATSTRGLPSTAVTVRPESNSRYGANATKDIVFGSLAGLVGKIVEYPFDTVKVRLQSQPDTRPALYSGPLDCFRKSLHQEGLRGLYRGVSAPLVGAAAESSSLFFSYNVAKDVLQSTLYGSSLPPTFELPLAMLVGCGAASGAFTSLVLTPIELVKCQMQVPVRPVCAVAQQAQAPLARPGPLAIVGSIYRRYGVLGFWHGQLGTFIREAGGSAAWFGSYEAVLILFRRFASGQPSSATTAESISHSGSASGPSSPAIYQQLLGGAVAGMSYNFICFPADTIKSRMQTEQPTLSSSPSSSHHRARDSERKSFRHVAGALYRQQGLRGFYVGCGITVLRSAPSSALIFTLYEGLKERFG